MERISPKLKITILTALAQLSIILTFFYSDYQTLIALLVTYLVIGASEQVFLHRLFVHRSWNCPRWLEIVGLGLSSLTLMGPSVIWVAVHRLHHLTSDTVKDPHSPLYHSHWYVQFRHPEFSPVILSYSKDLLKDKFHRFFFDHYFKIVFFLLLSLAVIFGLKIFLVGILPGIGLAYILANLTNNLSHGNETIVSKKSKASKDSSLNHYILGFLTFSGWHGNHHSYPTRWWTGTKWYQIDLAGLIIAALMLLTFTWKKNINNI
jgi:stearoyl-CoA desaturase (delta-9 desaturase)